jgi:hypothetical protein
MKSIIFGLTLLLFLASTAAALPPEAIGHIQTLKGAAYILRGGNTVTAIVGAPIFCMDTIRTVKTGAVGIILADDSSLSLGPNSEIAIKDYLFNPKEGKFAFLTHMVKGTFVYLSGVIGKLSPDSVRLEIPDAIIAVRGTRLLVKIDG